MTWEHQVNERLDALERGHRWTRRAVLAAGCVVAALVVALLAS